MQETVEPMVGYAFVKPQVFGMVYSPEDGLEVGTIFADLDLPKDVYLRGTMES